MKFLFTSESWSVKWMATTTPKVKILKSPLIKFNEIQNKKKKKQKHEFLWRKTGHTQNLGWPTTGTQQFTSIKSGGMIVINILETRTLEEKWTYLNWKHLGGDNFTHSKNMRNDTFFMNLMKPWWRNSKIFRRFWSTKGHLPGNC